MVSASPMASLPPGVAVALSELERLVLPLLASGYSAEPLPAMLPPKPRATTLAAWRRGMPSGPR